MRKREKVSTPTPDNAAWTTPEELTAAILLFAFGRGRDDQWGKNPFVWIVLI